MTQKVIIHGSKVRRIPEQPRSRRTYETDIETLSDLWYALRPWLTVRNIFGMAGLLLDVVLIILLITRGDRVMQLLFGGA